MAVSMTIGIMAGFVVPLLLQWAADEFYDPESEAMQAVQNMANRARQETQFRLTNEVRVAERAQKDRELPAREMMAEAALVDAGGFDDELNPSG